MIARYLYTAIVTAVAFLLLLNQFPFELTAIKHDQGLKGSNTLSFQENGFSLTSDSTIWSEVFDEGGTFYLNIWLNSGSKRFTFVVLEQSIEPGAIVLDDPNSRYISVYDKDQSCNFTSDEYYDGILVIHTYDTTEHIIAGSFEFIAWSQECKTLLRVTDGHFDLRMNKPL
jgi:hypothetical protein